MGNGKSDPRSTTGLAEKFVFVIAIVVLAVITRFAVVNDLNKAQIEDLGVATGHDYGEWPGFFYTAGGGDGEMFVLLATDPLGVKSEFTPLMVYRYTRVGLSLGAYALSFGQEGLVLPALATIGLFAVAAVAYLTIAARDHIGWRAWLLVLNPALYIGFARDTAEPLAIMLLILCIGWRSRAAAVLLGGVRPTYGVGVLGRWKLFFAVASVAIAVRLFAVWRFSGELLEGASNRDNFSLPFAAYFLNPSTAGFIVASAATISLLIGLWRRDWGWVAGGALVVILGPAVTQFPINLIRAAGFLPVLWAFGPRFKGIPSGKERNSVATSQGSDRSA